MKYILSFLLLVSFAGCSTNSQQAAYQSEATAVTSVSAAMSLWGAYVASNHPPVAQEQAVANAYAKYQASMLLVIDSTTAIVQASNSGTNSPNMTPVTVAISSVTQSATDLINIIQSFGVKVQ